MITYKLPLPPSLNTYYGHYCQKKRAIVYIKEDGKKYREILRTLIPDPPMANIPLHVTVYIAFKTRHKNDLDNRMKGLLDALTKADVWEDDSLIDHLEIKRLKVDSKDPHVTVVIEPDNTEHTDPYESN